MSKILVRRWYVSPRTISLAYKQHRCYIDDAGLDYSGDRHGCKNVLGFSWKGEGKVVGFFVEVWSWDDERKKRETRKEEKG